VKANLNKLKAALARQSKAQAKEGKAFADLADTLRNRVTELTKDCDAKAQRVAQLLGCSYADLAGQVDDAGALVPGRERPPQSLIDFVTNEVGANHRHPDMARGVGAAAGAGPLPAALAADLDALRAALKGKADHKDLQDLSDKLQRALATKADRQDVRALMDRPAAAPSAPVMGLPGGAGEGAGAGAGAGAGGPNSTLGLGQAAGPLGSPGSGLSGASSVGASGVVGGGDGKGGEGGTQELYKVVHNHANQIQHLHMHKADNAIMGSEVVNLKELMEMMNQRKADTDIVMRKAETTYVDHAVANARKEMIDTLNTASAGIVDTLDKSLNVLRGMLDTKADAMEVHTIKQHFADRGLEDQAGTDGLAGFRCLSCNKVVDMRPKALPGSWGQFTSTQRIKQAPPLPWKGKPTPSSAVSAQLLLTQGSAHSQDTPRSARLPPLADGGPGSPNSA